jgi:glutathione S-transferase
MLLYDNSWSGNCWKVRLMLARLGISYERHELDPADRSDRPEVLGELNPALRIPTLVLDDGRVLAESGAIVWYLADGTEWVPADPFGRAQVLQWMFFEQYDLEPNLAVLRFRAHAGVHASDTDTAARLAGGERALSAMERHLDGREWLVGDRDTIADVALYAYTHVAPEGGFSLEPYPAIRSWCERFATLPGHVGMDA